MSKLRLPLSSLLLFFLVSTAAAQTGPALLSETWVPDQWFSSSSDALFGATNHTDSNNPDHDARISQYESEAAFRLKPNSAGSTRIGFDVLDYDIVGHDPALPRNLMDARIGFVQPIMQLTNWWVAVAGTIGYAGNKLFNDDDALFGGGDIFVGRQLRTKDEYLVIGLDYNGNRTFLPDTPIPGLAYANRYNDYCTYVLGLPYTSITIRPVEGLQIEAGFTLVDTAEANVGYQFTKHFALFGQYTDLLSPFHINNTSPDSRIFFHTHQLEAGLRWNESKAIRLSLSGGWAFGQEFSNGWDSRNLTPLRHLSDGPFARFRVEIVF